MTPNPQIPTEAQEQQALIEWATLAAHKHPELALLTHIANEGKRSGRTGAQLVRMGLRKGFPDLLLPVARGGYHSLAIELKRSKGGKTSDAQRWWINRLLEQGYYATVCYGWQDARRVIEDYLKGEL